MLEKLEGIVEIPQCGIYAKSPKALKNLFSELKKLGYKIEDCSKNERDSRPSREVQEKNGWYLWYASLKKNVCKRKGKCHSCKSYIDEKGIQTPEHKCEVCGAYTYPDERYNHSIVRLYQGEEYAEHATLPIPDSYTIYESWHWAPLNPSLSLHEKIIGASGMVSRCDYYYQDGRDAFYSIHLERMRLYVEHFTTIPIDKWDAIIRRASKSGPGMIKTLAAFCQGIDVEKAVLDVNKLLINFV